MHIRQVISGLLIYAVCFGAMAQPPLSGPVHDRFTRMQQELNLSDEQVQQMRDIKSRGGSREEIHAVLTEEQLKKMTEMRAQHKPDRFQRMQKELNLSDEQVQQMQEIRARGGSREEIDAVLTEEQRKQWQELRAGRQGNMPGGWKGQGKGPPPAAESSPAPAADSSAGDDAGSTE